MRSNVILWWLLAGFFLLLTVSYTTWAILNYPDPFWYDRIEWVGSVAFLFATLMAAFIGWYLQRVHKAQGGELPEDRLTADVDDGDPEMGEFSPWSWWPIVLAASAGIAFVGLAVSVWMVPVGFALFLVAIVGWVYEYYRGYFAR
ncbi:cytochrome c oxidase subunit 4 [Microbacterium sp. LRZ72]|uniref:cytochrome c oxidase subunit 4 n=1 Tax=Microbacterium sp. LRZ72 TaxID=2942481 RepID=UPI0029B1A3C5|nr:cytochrome c oxidase subunit 4 [Microbacterium sp. LRZ72]MDX2377193.1 cytochrome c oxidase subunit 4 [Microbacterium sp. LRZ72]